MAAVNDDELSDLRKRAYGRSPDIWDDPIAFHRLQELEAGAVKNELSPRVSIPPVQRSDQDLPLVDDLSPGLRDDEPRQVPESPARAWLGWARRRLAEVRPSHALIGAGMVVIVMSLVVAMILVQRVQTDPLQVGATQIARLSVDPNYEIPPFFSGSSDPILGFEEFHGLRTVVSKYPIFSLVGGENNECLGIYSEADMANSTSSTYSGNSAGGCAAGAFPPMAQFRADMEGFPETLRSAFPEPTALQFVFDAVNNEVVVFAAPAPDSIRVFAAPEESFGPPPEITPVGEDLVASPPDRPIAMPGTVVSATSLGERGDYVFVGAVNDGNQVCLIMQDVVKDESSGSCTDYLGFENDGVTLDRGSWQVTWWADGRVEFEGI